MNAWLADSATLPSHDNGAFQQLSTIDPSAAFLHTSPAPQDPNQFQRMFNGVPRNASPGFQNPSQVIPSKRPRPEDGLPMSPRQGPGGLGAPRSQTPHQVPFPGYQGPANGTPQFQPHPNPYQHFPQGASPNVTQSPVMQDFDQNNVQRMGTASPSPFPAGPHINPHMSPSQSDHGSRVNTPQNNSFMPGQAFPQGVPPQFPTMTTAGVQAPMPAQFNGMPQYQQAVAAQQQRLHALQMQNQGRQMEMNPGMAGRPVAGGMNAMANPQQMANIRQMQQNMSKPTNPEAFMRSLQKFMMSRNMPLDPNPVVCGRPIHLVQLYATVVKLGGSKRVTAANMWPVVAQQLQLPPMQFPMAVQEIREHYHRNLAAYEQAFFISQQKQLSDQMPQNMTARPPGDPAALQFQSPVAKPSQGFEPPQQFANASPNNAPTPNNMQHASNGFAPPTQAKAPNKNSQHQHRLSASRHPRLSSASQDSPSQLVAGSPAQSAKGHVAGKSSEQLDRRSDQPLQHPIKDPFKPMVLPESNQYGPIAVNEMYQLGEEISRYKPDVPRFLELGVVDIHSLMMCIKSGIHAEVRVALDTLATISCQDDAHLFLESCDDLLESLIECAEDQAELLAEHTAEVSDGVLLMTYEEMARGCQSEWKSLADIPEFGSIDYDLDRAVDRLICIMTILRNCSFTEQNFGILSIPSVVTFVSTVIRYLGTRSMFLRTHQNTLDFMKDTLIYLSNVAHVIHLPGREESLCLLHFLLSFAPYPAPAVTAEGVSFTPYSPFIHKYTPAAVDSLAKLLARDEPNRTFFRGIFAGDGTSGPQPELLTRAFGLAVCPVPDQPRKPLAVADARKVFLLQGLLAADILSTYADGSLSKAWLESTDGFAIHLLRLSCLLSTDRVPSINQRQSQLPRGQVDLDGYAYSSLVSRGLTILRRLAEKSKLVDDGSSLCLPSGVLPKKESLLGALLMPNIDPGVIRQLITYAHLGE